MVQLIDDIHRHEQGKYYLGSLTVKKRNDGFEVIDGQQRLTTLFLLLSVLGYSFGLNLSFEHREDSSDELNVIKQGGDFKDKKLSQITMVYRYLKDNGKKLFNRDDKNQKSFLEKLRNQVQIIRLEIPENTDLNQYFERMNNRGEQLEHHEVIKAKLMSKLSDKDDKAVFSAIWNACSDMSRYAASSFSSNERRELFEKGGGEYFWLYENFKNIKTKFQKAQKSESGTDSRLNDKKLSIILKSSSIQPINEKSTEQQERFTSIIDFPNFLAQVLYLFLKDKFLKDKKGDIAINNGIHRLDEKNLIKQFEQSGLYESVDDIKDFALHLLNVRVLFDRHVIKHDGLDNKNDWYVYQFKKSGKNNDYTNVFENTNEDRQIKLLQTMFHYSFPARNYKYWLFAYLKWLNDESREKLKKHEANGRAFKLLANEHIKFLEKLCDKFYFNRFCNHTSDKSNKGDDYFDIIYRSGDGLKPVKNCDFLHQGTAVENFIFNRLDYILWRKNQSSDFKFTARNSVEHYYPQNPIGGGLSDELAKVIDSFGNLCLITHSQNSSLGNKMPSEKKAGYDVKRYSLLSLKQQRMFEYNAETWGAKEIMEHGEQMIRLLNQPISKIDATQSDA
ncbi:DUF262 domain-containing protein [Moraxella bovoculi]|uniref:DUF262 domain-containing protein n=1 Tax=Moraxella bovoculi TaxID=386891 RepID=UPI0018B089F9|nr:DUF262 domain-containing protein [Moraxella bovoculi]